MQQNQQKCTEKTTTTIENSRKTSHAARFAPRERLERDAVSGRSTPEWAQQVLCWQLGGRDARRHWNFYAFASLSPSNLYGFLYALLQSTTLLLFTDFFRCFFNFFANFLFHFARNYNFVRHAKKKKYK